MRFTGERMSRIIEKMAPIQIRRDPNNAAWKRVRDGIQELNKDENAVAKIVFDMELEAAADTKGFSQLVAGVGSDVNAVGLGAAICAATDPDESVTAASVCSSANVSGELGDGRILEQIQKFLEWLIDPETVEKLANLIQTLITLFSSFFAEEGTA